MCCQSVEELLECVNVVWGGGYHTYSVIHLVYLSGELCAVTAHLVLGVVLLLWQGCRKGVQCLRASADRYAVWCVVLVQDILVGLLRLRQVSGRIQHERQPELRGR